MLSLRQVCAGYGAIQVLNKVDIDLGAGEIVTLIGANGAGKTTTLRTIAGLLPLTGGEITFAGELITRLPPEKRAALGMSQAPEGRHIFPDLTVLENLNLGAYLRRDKAGIRRDFDYCFELFPILHKRRRQPGGALSGGEQQMLAIARALLQKPRALLLDEPSLGLAPLIVKQIFGIIRRINEEQQVSILLVEQNAYLALHTAHRGYVLEHGAITLAGDAADLLGNEAVREAYLGI